MAFQASSGNFRVDDQRRRAVRHLYQAVRPVAVGQRRLEFVGAVRQAVGDDRLHARLAERAARLLVGQDRLKLHDLTGQRLDIVLRIVDDGEPLLQLRQALMRRFGLLGHGLAEPSGHGVEALADRLRQLGLTRAEDFGHCAEPALHLRLRLQYAGHARIRVAGMVGGFGCRHRASLCGAPERRNQRDEQAQKQRTRRRPAPDPA